MPTIRSSNQRSKPKVNVVKTQRARKHNKVHKCTYYSCCIAESAAFPTAICYTGLHLAVKRVPNIHESAGACLALTCHRRTFERTLNGMLSLLKKLHQAFNSTHLDVHGPAHFSAGPCDSQNFRHSASV
eukprot:5945283-Pleurochrysis_carterae.AAC.1